MFIVTFVRSPWWAEKWPPVIMALVAESNIAGLELMIRSMMVNCLCRLTRRLTKLLVGFQIQIRMLVLLKSDRLPFFFESMFGVLRAIRWVRNHRFPRFPSWVAIEPYPFSFCTIMRFHIFMKLKFSDTAHWYLSKGWWRLLSHVDWLDCWQNLEFQNRLRHYIWEQRNLCIYLSADSRVGNRGRWLKMRQQSPFTNT